MKRLLFFAQLALFGLFNLALLATVLQLAGSTNPLAKLDYELPGYNGVEEFDPSLGRLRSCEMMGAYCDSIFKTVYSVNPDANHVQEYTDIVASTVRKRFYHGYSRYGFTNNYFAFLISKVTLPGYSAIVIPDDILKYDYAACSQQSIVTMNLLEKKGFKTRKVIFQGKTAGHFCFEVFYNNDWHFYDTNMEPQQSVLDQYAQPGIAFLAAHPAVLLNAYKQYPKEEILDVFRNYSYGSVNEFPAPRGLLFQRLTKVLSYILWAIFLILFIFVRRKYLRYGTKKYVRNSRIYFPPSQPATSSSYYPGFTAPRA